MFSYVNDEFYELILQNFNVDINRIGIFGHGIGGHGALTSFLKHPAQYKSVSALAPVYNLNRNVFQKFLGEGKRNILLRLRKTLLFSQMNHFGNNIIFVNSFNLIKVHYPMLQH